jgi:hypothetical protein
MVPGSHGIDPPSAKVAEQPTCALSPEGDFEDGFDAETFHPWCGDGAGFYRRCRDDDVRYLDGVDTKVPDGRRSASSPPSRGG